MNREEFMKRVEYLLSDLPEEEVRDAVDYYRDYLEEAGSEADEAMREFGSPERIASIIRSDVQGNLEDGGEFTDTGYTDERFREPNYQLVGRGGSGENTGNGSSAGRAGVGENRGNGGSAGQGGAGWNGGYDGGAGQYGSGWNGENGGSAGQGGAGWNGGNGGSAGQGGAGWNGGNGGNAGQGGAGGNGGNGGAPGQNGSGATKILWIVLAVIGLTSLIPALLGVASGAFGILVAVLVLLFVFFLLTGILTLAFLVAGVATVAAGIAAVFVSPLDGVMCVGVGLIILALGLVGIVLSVLIYGRLMPWLFRGVIDGLNGMLHRKERTA